MSFSRMTIGLIGSGAIGRGVLELLAREGGVAKLLLLRRAGASPDDAGHLLPLLQRAAASFEIVASAEPLAKACPVVVEAAGHEALMTHAPAILAAGRRLIAVSSGAFADRDLQDRLTAAADASGGQIIIPSGAIGAIDMIGAMAEGDPAIQITYTGRKPPHAWAGAPAVAARTLEGLTAPLVLFEGNAREAALAFPQNANVAATVALAAGSFERVTVRLVADPALTGNCHQLEVTAKTGRLDFSVRAEPSPGKAGTSQTTALSVFHTLRRLSAALAV